MGTDMHRVARFCLWSGLGLLLFSCAPLITVGMGAEPNWLAVGLTIVGVASYALSWVMLAVGAILKAIGALRGDSTQR